MQKASMKRYFVLIIIMFFLLIVNILLIAHIKVDMVYAEERKTTDTAIWWGCASIELNISGTTILIDPYFPFKREADIILITHFLFL